MPLAPRRSTHSYKPDMNKLQTLIEKLADKESNNCSCNGHLKCTEIFIGDVLERLHSTLGDDNVEKLMELWQPCGFTRSIQEIVKDVERLLDCKGHGKPFKHCGGASCSKTKERLKPEAQALIDFLTSIIDE